MSQAFHLHRGNRPRPPISPLGMGHSIFTGRLTRSTPQKRKRQVSFHPSKTQCMGHTEYFKVNRPQNFTGIQCRTAEVEDDSPILSLFFFSSHPFRVLSSTQPAWRLFSLVKQSPITPTMQRPWAPRPQLHAAHSRSRLWVISQSCNFNTILFARSEPIVDAYVMSTSLTSACD